VPEMEQSFPREWREIRDQSGFARIYRCDLTWLTSRWNCTYASGCPGTRRRHQGCCTVGAHWSGASDRERVEAWARRLPGDLWQFRETGQTQGITVSTGDDSGGSTRIVDGACVFLNRDGFATGRGCALHFLAVREGRPPLETKPDVCWQIPVRFSYAWERRAEVDTVVVTVGEYDRAAWGPGGADLRWWCSSNTEAHTASRPLYLTYADELAALLGPGNYEELTRICDQRCQSPDPPRPHPADPHPADPPGRVFLPFTASRPDALLAGD
jgi:hypothetical protein